MATNTTNLGMDYAGTSAPLLSEILTKVNNAKVKEEKVKILKQNDSVPLRQILKGAFDPKIEWDLPEGTPPYKQNEAPAGTEHTVLYTESKRLWHFIKGADPKLSKTRKEMMYIQMLEGLHADEAKLLINVKEKNLNNTYKGLTDAVVKEAFGWNEDYKTA
tara:strand:- start:1497 stop:1979 length:483 start_codon:yes stop_codon:yes gene_type:complete